MSFDTEKLYSLLPVIYRMRDVEYAERMGDLLTPAEQVELENLRALSSATAKEAKRLADLEGKLQRGPLKALLSVLAEQATVLEDNLDQLYEDFFIETCAEWVVPYIGELVGARGISAYPGASFTERAFVANTMAYRRRKGTVAVIEQLARDLTDWDASVVEYFQLLATTQYMNHIRLENLSLASLRDSKSLEFMNTPFDKVTRTVDVRRIEPRRGKYNIPNIGIYLWRLGSYSVTNAPAYRIDDGRYLFDVLGQSTQLFINPETEDEITHLAEPRNVPMPLSRRVLSRYLDTYYGLEEDGTDRSIVLSEPDPGDPEAFEPIAIDRIKVCDLSDLTDVNGDVVTDMNGLAVWGHSPTDKIAIDPVLGRIAFPVTDPATTPDAVRVTYHYGFSAEMGGGEYDREQTFAGAGTTVRVPEDEPTIQQALDQITSEGGIVEITRNDLIFETPLIVIESEDKQEIELRAPEGKRPVIAPSGDLIITGSDESEVIINGLVIAGRIRIPELDASGDTNKLRRLRLRHCTIVPGPIAELQSSGDDPAILVPAQPAATRLLVECPGTRVEIDNCIIGSIQAVETAYVTIRNSIVDSTGASEIAFMGLTDGEQDALIINPGAPLTIENSTIIGKVFTRTMKLASNTIFFSELEPGDTWPAPVRAERLQQGCVRFSYVPPGSQLPRLHRCQPEKPQDATRVRPAFTSLRFGEAAYCQLSRTCAVEITSGADDQVEMGAFHNLYQPRREANLRAALGEYLRFGLEAGIFNAS
jgi:hypothetical protein